MPNEIPTSPALSEASSTSLQDLFSRLPESRQDISAIITEMRKMRERLDAADAAQPIRQPRAAKPPTFVGPTNPSDFGI